MGPNIERCGTQKNGIFEITVITFQVLALSTIFQILLNAF